MIPHGVEVFVGLDPIDLRWGFDRLCGIAEERVGALFVFFGKRRAAIKVLFFDGSGLCIFYNQRASHNLAAVEVAATFQVHGEL